MIAIKYFPKIKYSNEHDNQTVEIETYQVTSEDLSKAAKDIGQIENEKRLVDFMMNMAIQKVQFQEDENFKIKGTVDA